MGPKAGLDVATEEIIIIIIIVARFLCLGSECDPTYEPQFSAFATGTF
jgi:hypothetical protein